MPEEVREAQPAQELPDRPAGGEPQILQEPVPMDLEEEPAEEQEDVVRAMARIMETQLEVFGRMTQAEQPRRNEPGPPRSQVARLMTFDGSDPWPEYEAHLEEYAKYYQWTDQQKAMNLSVSLRGNARSILLDLPAEDRQDYRTLAGALKQHFCPAEKIFVYQAELQNRRLQPEEELPDFAREIRRKTRLAFPTADPATLETLMKTHFCNGLTNRDMRLTVLKSHPCTIT